MQSSEQTPTKRRHWWVALLLFLVTWLGAYFYLGRPKRGAISLLVWFAVICLQLLGPGKLLSIPQVYFAVLALFLIGIVALVLDVIVLAIRTKNYQLQAYNKWWVYLLCVIPSLLISYQASFISTHAKVRGFYAPSTSMVPTLRVDEFFVADMTAYRDALPERGDVIIMRHPRSGVDYVKRIVALPGEEISVPDGKAVIDGQSAEWVSQGTSSYKDRFGRIVDGEMFQSTLKGQSFMVFDKTGGGPQVGHLEFVVPQGHYFVLGDNRDNSTDSRFAINGGGIGYIPLENIKGKVRGIYFSDDWSRLFMSAEPVQVN